MCCPPGCELHSPSCVFPHPSVLLSPACLAVLLADDCQPCAAGVLPALRCREVVERLQRPVWMRRQHRLWPAPFKAAVQMLLMCLHRCAALLAGVDAGAGGGAGDGGAMEVEGEAAVAVPKEAVLGIVRYLGQAWWE